MPERLQHHEIAARLGLRTPWKLLDLAVKCDDTHWVGFKSFTVNEAFFTGHFPVHPIVPGVLQIEAVRQLCLCFLPGDPAAVRIRQLDRVKFRRQVLPGDRMRVEVELLETDGVETKFKAVCSTLAGSCSEGLFTMTTAPAPVPALSEVPELAGECARTAEITMDTDRVMSLMPHRYPFLLIDYIASAQGGHIIAVKNVSGNEPFFDAGFDAVPESLMCEISAQSGCACVLARPENAGKLGFFMAIDKAVYHRRLYPGERALVEIDLPESKSRFGKGSGMIRVGSEVIMEVSLMFALVDA